MHSLGLVDVLQNPAEYIHVLLIKVLLGPLIVGRSEYLSGEVVPGLTESLLIFIDYTCVGMGFFKGIEHILDFWHGSIEIVLQLGYLWTG